jgi:hypothetical protein
LYPSLDPNETERASRLERGATDARGPLELGCVRGLLTRRQAGRVWVSRSDGAALGRRDRSSATNARRPLGLGQLSRLLTRRQAGHVWIWGSDGAALGRRDRSRATDAPVLLEFRQLVAFSPDGKLLPTLRVSNHWVVEGKSNILWLPPDYQSICEAIWDQSVILGHTSGRLSFLQFRQEPKLVV